MQTAKMKEQGLAAVDSIQLLRLLSEQSTEGFLAFDTKQRYVFWSKGMEQITGMAEEEVIGKPSFEVFPFLKEIGIDKAYDHALSGKTVFLEEQPYRIPETKRFGFFSSRYAPLRNQKGEICGGIAVIQDVTEKRAAREKAKESENRFRNMADCSPVMLWMSGQDAMCIFFNQTWLQFTGRSLDQEIGVGWSEGLHFEDFQKTIDVYIEAFNKRQPFEMEYRLRRADGEFRWISDRALPRYSPDGTFSGYIGSCVDITEQKKNEEALKSAIAAREEFLSIASHELKTPLTSLTLQMGLFQHLLKKPNELANLAPKIETFSTLASRQLKLLSKLIENLLDVSRASAGGLVLDLQEMDIVQTVAEVVSRFSEQAELVGSEFQWTPPNPIIGIWDKVRIEQVISNLVSNAIKYGQGRPVQLEMSDDGGQVILKVRDHGAGIALEQQHLIFEKFQRFKISKKIEGLGLGLFIAKQIVDGHGGRIFVNSTLGNGAEFVVNLPKNAPQVPNEVL